MLGRVYTWQLLDLASGGGVNSCPKQGKKNCVFLAGFCGWMQSFDEHVRKEKLDMPGCHVRQPFYSWWSICWLPCQSCIDARSNRLKLIVFDELMKCLWKSMLTDGPSPIVLPCVLLVFCNSYVCWLCHHRSIGCQNILACFRPFMKWCLLRATWLEDGLFMLNNMTNHTK